jgi:signal transduction histidine kinase/CheY-like chemotaxis protein
VAQERVLIIENDAQVQKLLAKQVLKPSGYQALLARDGKEGLRLAEEKQPDLIILDMNLPKMNGLKVLEALQQRDVDTPVIFTAAPESAGLVVQALRLGACDYVVKPFDPQEMQEAIQRALVATTLREERDQLTRQLLETNQQLQRQLQELNAIYTIGRSVTSVLDLSRVLNRVVEAAVYVAGAEEGMLLLLDEEGDELYLRAAKDLDDEFGRNLRVRVDDSAAGRAIQTGRPVLLSGGNLKLVTGYLTKALLYLPLRVPERGVIGVLGVVNRESERSFVERDVFLLSALADYAAIAIENARLFERAEVERAKLEAVLREAQEPVIVADGETTILLCNAAARIALSLGETAVLHLPVSEAISNTTLCEMFIQASETERVVHGEVPTEDGHTFNAQLTPIEGVGWVLVMQDITHLKELDRVKTEFVSAVSHDLRTPLTSILGYVELLPKVGPLNDQQQGFVQRVHESMETITELIGTLLDINRIEAGFDLEIVPCDLVEVIEEVLGDIRPMAQEKEQDVRWQPPKALPLVQGNPHRLRQVLDNLLSNAVKYTPKRGWVAVSVEREGEHVVVHVADNGIGIPPSQQPYVFDKFFRVESDDTLDIAGSGLGLSIVKAVIERHNGRVWVQSKPREGSVFSFVLPAMRA